MNAAIRWMMAGLMAGAALMSAMVAGGCQASRSDSYTLDVAATTGLIAVDIENFRGTVEVRSGAKGDRITVSSDAEVNPLHAEEDRARILAGISVDATLEEDGARAVLRVRSTSASVGSEDHRVHLVVRAPRVDGVRVVNAGGDVVVVGAGGATEITNRFGAIELRTDKAMNDPVTLLNVEGNIYYQVPKTSTGAFDLETLEGVVRYRDRVASTDRVYAAPRIHQARLNEGTNPVLARTNKGDVMVWVDKDPVALTRIIKKSFPDPRDLLFQQGSRRYTRNLPEDHPEVTGSLRSRKYMFYD